MKEVGKIKNNKATFLSITLDVDIRTGYISSDVNYDIRVIDKNKQEILENLVHDFVKKINKCALKESEDKQ